MCTVFIVLPAGEKSGMQYQGGVGIEGKRFEGRSDYQTVRLTWGLEMYPRLRQVT